VVESRLEANIYINMVLKVRHTFAAVEGTGSRDGHLLLDQSWQWKSVRPETRCWREQGANESPSITALREASRTFFNATALPVGGAKGLSLPHCGAACSVCELNGCVVVCRQLTAPFHGARVSCWDTKSCTFSMSTPSSSDNLAAHLKSKIEQIGLSTTKLCNSIRSLSRIDRLDSQLQQRRRSN